MFIIEMIIYGIFMMLFGAVVGIILYDNYTNDWRPKY